MKNESTIDLKSIGLIFVFDTTRKKPGLSWKYTSSWDIYERLKCHEIMDFLQT